MARPNKSGLEYFPLDIDIFSDDKVEYVSAKFDEKGELIVIKLLCMIYRNGFYTEWNEDKATIFAKRAGRNISPSLVKDVVEELVKRGFFDKDIFNSFAVLTSRGIQKRYLKAILDRTDVEIISDYWVIDIPENTQRTKFSIINMGENSYATQNPGYATQNPGFASHNDVKESKVNKTKDPPLPPTGEPPQDALSLLPEDVRETAELWLAYKRERKQTYKPQGLKQLIDRIKENAELYGIEAVTKLVKNCIASNYQGITWDGIGKIAPAKTEPAVIKPETRRY